MLAYQYDEVIAIVLAEFPISGRVYSHYKQYVINASGASGITLVVEKVT